MDGWLALANRGLRDVEILMWNHIAMQWATPFFIVGFVGGCVAGIFWLIKRIDD